MVQESSNFIKTTGATIYFEVGGVPTGIPLIVLHGGPGFDHSYLKTSSVWDDLGQKRPVIFYDQRGTGQSSIVAEGDSCTFADQLADLEALRAHLGYDLIDILGHSWGGFLGMAYSARHHSRTRRLVLVDSGAPRLQDTVFLFEDIFPETVDRQKAVAFAEELGDEDAVQASIAEYLSMLCYSPENRDSWLSKVDPTIYKHNVYQVLWNDAKRFDLSPELPKLPQPTMVITGRYDINVAPSVAYGIHKAIPGSRFVVFERSGHLPFFEEPDAFKFEIENFLSES